MLTIVQRFYKSCYRAGYWCINGALLYSPRRASPHHAAPPCYCCAASRIVSILHGEPARLQPLPVLPPPHQWFRRARRAVAAPLRKGTATERKAPSYYFPPSLLSFADNVAATAAAAAYAPHHHKPPHIRRRHAKTDVVTPTAAAVDAQCRVSFFLKLMYSKKATKYAFTFL